MCGDTWKYVEIHGDTWKYVEICGNTWRYVEICYPGLLCPVWQKKTTERQANMDPRFFPTPEDFRSWLQENHDKQEELWVGYYKKATKKPSITWPESVDEALCFGWIDGLRKSIDEESYKIRFTPRRPSSIWSAVNIRRFEELKKLGRIRSPGQAAYERRKEKRSERYSYEQGTLELAEAYEKKIRANKKAWDFFRSLPPSVQKPSIWYVMSAKREETRLRRLETLIQCSEEGQRIPQLRR